MELALVLPLVVALLFGMIDFCVVLNDYQSPRAGTRDGTRNAVVADFDAVSSCSGSGSSSQSLICSVKALTSLDSPDTRVLVPGTGEVGAALVVCAAEPMHSTSGVFEPLMSGSVLKSKVTMRIEVEADPVLVTASDPAVAGRRLVLVHGVMKNPNWDRHQPAIGNGHERGVVAMLFALSIVVLFGFTAFVIDLGNARQTARGVQSASDAAVLAGAQDLPIVGEDAAKASTARGIAASYAASSMRGTLTASACSSGGADTDCFSIGVSSMEVSSPYNGDSQQIFTRICEPTETFFAGAIGQSSPTVCRSATAQVSSSAGGSPAILALDPSACGAINTHGNGDILAVGMIQVNSSCPSSALTQEGSNSEILSDSCVCVVGGFDMQFPGNAVPAATPGAAGG